MFRAFIFLILFTAVSVSITIAGENPKFLKITGMLNGEGMFLEGTQIRIYSKGQLIDSVFSKKGGEFVLFLGKNNLFMVDFYREGYEKIRLLVDTRASSKISPEMAKSYSLDMVLEMMVYETHKSPNPENLDLLDYPCQQITYNAGKDVFEPQASYANYYKSATKKFQVRQPTKINLDGGY